MDSAHMKKIAQLGGLARARKYGNPGTPEGRRQGGINSLLTHRRRDTGFKTLLKIRRPKPSTLLSEFLGILMGDGHIDHYQTSMTTNSETDREHAEFCKRLFYELFGIKASIRKRSGQMACVVTASSKALCDFLVKLGMVKGNKVRKIKSIPAWINKNLDYKKAFTRGLFDTDGCVYLDTHVIKGSIYKNIGIVFTNHSIPLMEFFKNTLFEIGLHPTQKTPFSVFLRREKEIIRYFEVIGTSNPKHYKRFKLFLKARAKNWRSVRNGIGPLSKSGARKGV